ncbi:MAG: radical SAM protein [Candidatus Adiutrix sp.]
MLCYRHGPSSDPFYQLYQSPAWLTDYDPPRQFPFWLNLELTNHCQLDCLFCSRQKSRRPLGYMNLETLKIIINEASNYPECGLRLTGWGEPLLHPQIAQIVTMIKQASLPLKIYTNGLALTPELMQVFIEQKVDDLQFSMQGLTPKQYEFNRRQAKYANLRQAIEMAATLRGTSSHPFLSVLSSVLADEAETADSQAFCQDMLTLVDKVAIDLTNLNFVSDQKRIQPFLKNQSDGLVRGLCVDVFLALEIKYDGLIQFCGQDAEALPEHSLGYVSEITLHEAWHSPKMNGQRNQVGRKMGHEAMSVCQNCYHNTKKYDLFKE